MLLLFFAGRTTGSDFSYPIPEAPDDAHTPPDSDVESPPQPSRKRESVKISICSSFQQIFCPTADTCDFLFFSFRPSEDIPQPTSDRTAAPPATTTNAEVSSTGSSPISLPKNDLSDSDVAHDRQDSGVFYVCQNLFQLVEMHKDSQCNVCPNCCCCCC